MDEWKFTCACLPVPVDGETLDRLHEWRVGGCVDAGAVVSKGIGTVMGETLELSDTVAAGITKMRTSFIPLISFTYLTPR